MSRDLKAQLKSLKHQEVKPSEEWLQKNRELLLFQVRNTLSLKPVSKFNAATLWQALSVFLPSRIVYSFVRPMIAILLIISMGVGSWIATVDASSDALPGDWLYSTKRAAEKTQVAVVNVVGTKTSQTKVHVELAKRRANEAKKLATNPSKKNMVATTVSDLKDEMKNVNQKLDEIKKSNSDTGAAEATKNIAKSAQEIKDALKEVKASLLTNVTTTASDSLAAQVAEAKDMAKDTAVKAVEVMISKHLQGDTSISKEDVKQAISAQLNSAVKETTESQQNTADVNKVVSEVNTEVKEMAREARGGDASLASSTKVLSTMINETAKQTQNAVNQSQRVASTTDKKVSEAQQLLSQDNLQQAIDVVKEIVITASKAEQIADNTMQAVQTVLPVVSVVSDSPVSSSINVVVSTTPQSATVGLKIISVSTTIKLETTTILTQVVSSTASSSVKK